MLNSKELKKYKGMCGICGMCMLLEKESNVCLIDVKFKGVKFKEIELI